MHENTAGYVKQMEKDCEALFVIREAERLEVMTLACYDIDAGDADVEFASTDLLDEDEDQDQDIHTWGMDFCVAQVQKAAWAVVEEARRLQLEVEHYSDQLLTGAPGDDGDSSLAPEDSAPIGNRDDVVQEAMAIVRETKRLQELVMRLFACVEKSAQEAKNNND